MSVARNLWGEKSAVRGPSAFVLASVVSGLAWYFGNRRIKDYQLQQRELIKRVENEEVVTDFKKTYNYLEPEVFDGKKVNIDGVIKPGRFFVKRNRGTQEGYLVLAPFVINMINTSPYCQAQGPYTAMTINRKFVINLGWIPRSRKHQVYTTVDIDAYGEEPYPDRNEALEKQANDGLTRDPLMPSMTVPVTNLTCYIRKGEKEDRINGRINWQQNYLYKWIDLKLLSRAFRMANQAEGETIYFERTFRNADDPESFPLQATKETVMEDIKNTTKNNEVATNTIRNGVIGTAFAVASWMTFF